MLDTEMPPLSTGYIDRDATTRNNPDELVSAWNSPSARSLLIRQGLVAVEPATGKLIWSPTHGDWSPNCYYIGIDGATPIFAVHAAEGEEPVLSSPIQWVHPFTVHNEVTGAQREALTVALALTNWHEHAEFSPRTGEMTSVEQAGWARSDSHGGEFFPRTDPAVIVCVEHNDHILLGSNVLWESGRFSLLAGFIEAGESAEQAVVREVKEEAGVSVTDVRYIASQPWPYPRSLMMGFSAILERGDQFHQLIPEPGEISELRWFTREQLLRPDPGVKLPQSMSIARWLIDRWIEQGDSNA